MFAYSGETSKKKLIQHLSKFVDKGIWFTRVNQENGQNREVLKKLNARFISSQVAGVGSDIYGIWYAGKRKIDQVSARQQINFSRMERIFDARGMVKKLSNMDFQITDRGQAYGGPKKTWRRIPIRSSGEDRNKAAEQIKNHPVFKSCPKLLKVLEYISPLNNFDYMMLTQVLPEDGMIARHTDIALDRDKVTKGLDPGKTMRFHVVIQSNPECEFHIWDLQGNKQTRIMQTGEIWYTDVRKPHSVDNKGNSVRLHLVVDCFADSQPWKKFVPSSKELFESSNKIKGFFS